MLYFIKLIKILVIFILCITTLSAAFAMEVAITVDDLPIAGELAPNTTRLQMTRQMMDVFKKHNITGVYGFLNAGYMGEEKNSLVLLKEWIKQGYLLGNHTYTHLDLAKVSTEEYLSNIQKNEAILINLMNGRNYKYFRYPYLSEGNTEEKRNQVRKFLFKNNYQITPVTVDFFEYEWNAPYIRCLKKHDEKSIDWIKENYLKQSINALIIAHELSMFLFHRDIKNILLVHINSLSVQMLDNLLTTYEQKGVKFISLEDALSDEAYQINPNIVRDRAYTFLNQVRLARGLKNPDNVTKLYDNLPEDKLNKLCT